MADYSGKRSLGQRENQEDALSIVAQSSDDTSGDVLMIVSDGMGGHVGGEIASNLAIKTFENHFISGSKASRPKERLLESAHAANAAIAARIKGEPQLKGMGCTLIGALKMNNRLIWVSIGDSLVYIYRQGTLRRLNADHSIYGELMEMVKAGKIAQSEADAHPRRNALRSALIGNELSLIDLNGIELEHGDVVVLATDGLDSLPTPKLAELLTDAKRKEPAVTVDALLDGVARVGKPNQDNTTVVVYRHVEEGRTSLSPNSKWKLSPNEANGAKVRKAGWLIAGLSGVAALALLVAVWAFTGAPEPVVVPDPAPVPTDQTADADENDTDDIIGGGGSSESSEAPSDGIDDGTTIEEGTTPTPSDGTIETLPTIEDETQPAEGSQEGTPEGEADVEPNAGENTVPDDDPDADTDTSDSEEGTVPDTPAPEQ